MVLALGGGEGLAFGEFFIVEISHPRQIGEDPGIGEFPDGWDMEGVLHAARPAGLQSLYTGAGGGGTVELRLGTSHVR